MLSVLHRENATKIHCKINRFHKQDKLNVLYLQLESSAVLLSGATGSVRHVNTSNHAPYFIQS